MTPSANDGLFTGCLPMRGVRQWADQVCAQTIASADLEWPTDVTHHVSSIRLTLAVPGTPPPKPA